VMLRAPITQGRVSAQHHRGAWTDVGTPERLRWVDQMLSARS
jgi:N-acetyl-alpha-D-muramate 1-phosphate uridylyltransferase